MHAIYEQMLKNYDLSSIDRQHAVKEIMQEMVLCGLSRAGFFKSAAFYGGTALRIFHGLDRFSEDLDFSLKVVNPSFDLKDYFSILEREIASFGLKVDISEKKKSQDSQIKSAFLKGNTKQHLMLFFSNEAFHEINQGEKIRIKFEVDTIPPEYAQFEQRFRLLPYPYEISLYDAPSLFAGKIHAVLCRSWKSRIKGRDLYDYVFFLTKQTPVNLKHLRARLLQSGYLNPNDPFTIPVLQQLLKDRFASIDYEQAKTDVLPFIRDPKALDIWSAPFFQAITNELSES